MSAPIADTSHATVPIPLSIVEKFGAVEGLAIGAPVALVVKGVTNVDGLRTRRHVERMRAEQQGRVWFQPLRGTDDGGFIALLAFGPDLQSHLWRQDGIEPRGFAQRDNLTVIACANELRLVKTSDGRVIKTIRHPNFGNIHTVDFSPTHPDRVLVSSFGFDRLIEMDLPTERVTWSWVAWLHGYGRNVLGLRLVAKGDASADVGGARRVTLDEASALTAKGRSVPCGEDWVLEVDVDNVTHPLGLENWQKVAQPNWAAYGAPGKILATFFNTNEAVEIDRESGTVRVLVADLAKPHGVVRFADGYLISDTAHGRVLRLDETFAVRTIYDLSGFPLAEDAQEHSFEWIQYTQPIGDGTLLATVDVRRACIIIWNPGAEVYSIYKYPRAWAVQSVLPAYMAS